MGRLRVLSGRDVRRILEQNGFVLVRQRGDRMVMQRQVPDSTITVPVPDHREVRVGTLLSINPTIPARKIAIRGVIFAQGAKRDVILYSLSYDAKVMPQAANSAQATIAKSGPSEAARAGDGRLDSVAHQPAQ